MAKAQYNHQRLYDALKQLTLEAQQPYTYERPAVLPQSQVNIAKYLSGASLGLPDAPEVAATTAQAQRDNERRERSGFTHVMDYLSSLGTGVQNTILDIGELARGEDSFGKTIGDIGTNVGATAAHVLKPLVEIAAVPGVETPWEGITNPVANLVEEHSIRHHGSEDRTHGSKVLESFGWNPESTGGRIGKAIAGFGVDVLTDPLTYLGGAGLISKGGKVAKEVPDAVSAINDLAAGKPSIPVALGREPELPSSVSTEFKPPDTPEIVNPFSDPIRSFVTPQTSITRQTNEWGMTPLQEQLMKTGVVGLTTETQRAARATAASHKRWYETNHPVEVPSRGVGNRKPDTQQLAKDHLAEHLDELPIGEVSREQLTDLYQRVLSTISATGSKLKPVDNKYIAKGIEDELIQRGNIVRDSDRLSNWLTKNDDLDVFVQGKPLKEMPDFYPRAHEAKQAAKQADEPGINAFKVDEIIDRIANGGLPQFSKKFTPATGILKADAERLAKEQLEAISVKGSSTLNPVNQANLWNRINNHVRRNIAEQREMAGRKFTAPRKDDPIARASAIGMMRAAEDAMIAAGKPPVAWDGSGLRFTDVLSEIGPDNLTSEYVNQVLDAFKTGNLSKIKDANVQEAITRAMAARKLDVSAVANIALDGFSRADDIMKNSVSPARYEAWRRGKALKVMNQTLKNEGLTSKEISSVRELVKSYIDPKDAAKLPFEEYKNSIRASVASDVKTGKFDPAVVTKLENAIEEVLEEAGEVMDVYKALGSANSSNYAGRAQRLMESFARDSNIVNSMMIRYTTWYGRGEMWQPAKEAYSFMEELAKSRGRFFANMVKNHTKEEQLNAWKLAIGAIVPTGRNPSEVFRESANEKVAGLADQMYDLIDTLVGSRSSWEGLADDAMGLSGTAAIKAQATMADVDKQLEILGSTFRFSKWMKGKATKGENEYSRSNWLLALENVDPVKDLRQEPAAFLMDIDRAFGRVFAEYTTIDDFVKRFGKRAGEPGYRPFEHITSVKHHRIPDDVKFDPKVAEEFSRLLKELKEGPWRPKGKIATFFRAQRAWKTGVTIYSPSHHSRNMVGDTWLMWMDGISDPRVFTWAAKILHAERANYKNALQGTDGLPPDLQKFMGFINRDEYAIQTANEGTRVFSQRGIDFTTSELYAAARNRGLLPSSDRVEDIIGEPLIQAGPEAGALRQRLAQPLGGRGGDAARGVSEYREHYARMAHFAGAVKQGITPSVAKRLKAAGNDPQKRREILEPIYEKASARVTKWHPDGRDLTRWEQSWGRGLIPFYAWQRKSIPLFIQAMVERPRNISKMMSYPRASFAVQQAMGIESPGPTDQFPEDELFPDWIRGGGIGPIGEVGNINPVTNFFGKLGRQGIDRAGREFGFTVIDPGNPFQDFIQDFGTMPSSDLTAPGLIKTIMDQSTPFFQIPAQIASKTRPTGAPIPEEDGGQGWTPWALEQVPILANLQRIVEIGEEPRQGREGGLDSQAFMNWLTGAGMVGTGAYEKSAEFDLKRFLERTQGGN